MTLAALLASVNERIKKHHLVMDERWRSDVKDLTGVPGVALIDLS